MRDERLLTDEQLAALSDQHKRSYVFHGFNPDDAYCAADHQRVPCEVLRLLAHSRAQAEHIERLEAIVAHARRYRDAFETYQEALGTWDEAAVSAAEDAASVARDNGLFESLDELDATKEPDE